MPTPETTAFVDDTSTVGAGKSRLTVRHFAAAPAVDVRANEKAVFKDVTNPNEKSAVVDAGTVSADVHSAPGGVEAGTGNTQAGTDSAAAWLTRSAGAAGLFAGALALRNRRQAATTSRH